MPEAKALRLLDRMARAGVGVVSLPLTNGFLLDRGRGRTPRRRGLTLVQEMRARAIPLAFASDNVQDPFHPHGNFDMLEVLRRATQAAQLEDDPSEWLGAVAADAAAVLGPRVAPAHAGRIRAGAPADLVILDARGWIDLHARAHENRKVLRAGRPLAPLREPAFARALEAT